MSMQFQWKFVGCCCAEVVLLQFHWYFTEISLKFYGFSLTLIFYWNITEIKYMDFQSNWWISQKFHRKFGEILVIFQYRFH